VTIDFVEEGGEAGAVFGGREDEVRLVEGPPCRQPAKKIMPLSSRTLNCIIHEEEIVISNMVS
jgi:hypothetical protein